MRLTFYLVFFTPTISTKQGKHTFFFLEEYNIGFCTELALRNIVYLAHHCLIFYSLSRHKGHHSGGDGRRRKGGREQQDRGCGRG